MAENNTIHFNQVQKSGKFGNMVDILNANFNLAKEAILQMKGKSAYEIWREQPGNENKTQEEFLASLRESGFNTKVVVSLPGSSITDTQTVNATANTTYSNIMAVDFASNQSFIVNLKASATGIFKDEQVSIQLYKNGSRLTGSNATLEFTNTYTRSEGVDEIRVSRASTGVLASGSLTISVTKSGSSENIEEDTIYAYPNGANQWSESIYVNGQWFLLATHPGSLADVLNSIAKTERRINALEAIIGDSSAINTEATQVGVEYDNSIDIDIPINTEFILEVSGDIESLKDNSINIRAIDIDDGIHSLYSGVITVPYILTDTKPYAIKRIALQRLGGGVIGDGEITLAITVGSGGKFYTKEEINAQNLKLKDDNAKLQVEIDTINKSLSGSSDVSQTIAAVAGTQYLNEIATSIEAGTNFVVSVNGDEGIINNDILGLQIFSASKRLLYETINSVSFEKTYNFSEEVVRIYISRAANAIVSSGNITLNVNTNDATFYNKDQIDALIRDVAYVSPNGLDTNDGTETHPYLTINKALNAGASMILVAGGNYFQQIDFSNALTKRNITIQCTDAHNKALFRPESNAYILATSASLYGSSTKVYSISVSGFSATITAIYQEGINDANTLINGEERLPHQRGKQYRCENTLIRSCDSDNLSDALEEMETNDDYRFYYANNTIYFTCPSSISAAYPITYAKGLDLFTNLTKDFKLNVVNVEVWYMSFNLYNIGNAHIEDCAAKYIFDEGAFMWVDATSVTFVRCEAARNIKGDYGDGFNGHATKTGDAFAKTCVASLIDCWAHDNNDDGYSDHERAEMVIRGGLYEYNGKGGIVPAYGSHCSCYGVYSRCNYNGFYYIGNTPSDEGGMYGQMLCVDCVAENNTREGSRQQYNFQSGYVVDGNTSYNRVTLVNCKSIGNGVGYFSKGRSTIVLIDCGSINDTTNKSVSENGSILIKNTTIINS